MTPHWTNLIFHFQEVSIVNNILFRDRTCHSIWSLFKDFVWFECVKAFRMLSHSLWVHICISPIVSKWCCFLGVIHDHFLLYSFCLLFYIDPRVFRGDFNKDILFLAKCPKSLILFILSSCKTLWLLSFTIKRNFSYECWWMHWSRSTGIYH